MFDFATLLTFTAVVIGLFLIPGPAVLLTAARTMQSGRKAGVITGLGLAVGDFTHTIFAAVGLSAILMTSATAFNAVKLAGALYLFYMGIRALLTKAADAEMAKTTPVSSTRIFSQAVLAEMLNPKTALFFLAFLPQFVDPARGASMLQFLTLGAIFVLLGLIYTTMIAFVIGPVSGWLKRISWLNQGGNKFIGLLYIGLGVKVAFQGK
ncbi:LysE family translocator [Domibacillus enclensis]|uniref:Lysine transporter LysE n=1 Tax=Domibacillus enclensis TaxID=1017273 RepID=A0A1N7AC82_9BACI|nr:LysE family translocator [Domibacillus enclensis]OXS75768.1 lysine transporter LysE [Domibacillus enclensis]SIR36614.1 Threonine/homoserine/homoserine lactone efflux protein [Domibacillus enclensis]